MATEPQLFESSPSDAALVARAVAGETEAYDLLIARHQERWLLYARGTIRDPDIAEDVLQEALVRAYKSLSKCKDQERFGAWFFQILVNQCRTASRKDARRTRRWQWGKPLLQEEAEHRSSDWDVSKTIPCMVIRRALAQGLRELPPEMREVLTLKYLEGKSYKEMAALTGDSVPALKMRANRALHILRPHVERHQGETHV